MSGRLTGSGDVCYYEGVEGQMSGVFVSPANSRRPMESRLWPSTSPRLVNVGRRLFVFEVLV